ncbi:hypothetical protein F2Q68_00030551 [Brassica cretica]|uniref:Uncharacterized protein n=1 Tax=Brassica cretica TaxID=69181 RepID=A0A8S9GEY7_BRACR|nr:hypothetical protein F2Q68_00030551 [Brassica cretica]
MVQQCLLTQPELRTTPEPIKHYQNDPKAWLQSTWSLSFFTIGALSREYRPAEPALVPRDHYLSAHRQNPSPLISPSRWIVDPRSGFSVSPKSRLPSTPPSLWSRRNSRTYRISPPYVSSMKLKVDLSSQSIEHLDQHEERGEGGKEKERREMEEVSGAEINWAESRVFLLERSESFCFREVFLSFNPPRIAQLSGVGIEPLIKIYKKSGVKEASMKKEKEKEKKSQRGLGSCN